MRTGHENRTQLPLPVARALTYLALVPVVLLMVYVAVRWTAALVVDVADQLHG